MMPYAFTRVDPPDIDPRSCIINVGVGRNTLGVEVTDSLLASCCDLGNIDSQHGNASGPDVPGRAAIDVALGWPLPPLGATLVTIRPDPDSIGAMAVLALRAEGAVFTPDMSARVALVSRSDCFDFGDWASWSAEHPPPVAGEALLPLSLHPFEIRALAASIGSDTNDLSDNVAMMRHWLLTGTLPPHGEILLRAADKHAAVAWSAGLLRVDMVLGGKVSHIQSDYPSAIMLGYRFAPIVVAEGKVNGNRKISIAQFERGHLDMNALSVRLNVLEPGWGGSDTILGSPQRCTTLVEIGHITDLIEEIGVIL
jgi:hypothetical protein